MQTFLMVLMFLTAVLLILLVLVQRGKGGGLAGALGGMGGQSAFGTKAGDMFTKITVGMATFWILLCMVAVATMSEPDTPESKVNLSGTGVTAPAGEDGAGGAPSGGVEGAAPAGDSE